MEQSGTVWVAGTVAGKTDTAKVAVTVVPCVAVGFVGCATLSPTQITELNVLLKSYTKKTPLCMSRAAKLSNMLGNNQIHSFVNETLRGAVGVQVGERIGIKLELFGGVNSKELIATAMHESAHTFDVKDDGPDPGAAELEARSCVQSPPGFP